MSDKLSQEEIERRLDKFREEESKPPAPPAPRPASGPPVPPRPVPRPAPRPGGPPMPIPRRTNPLAEEVRRRKKVEAERLEIKVKKHPLYTSLEGRAKVLESERNEFKRKWEKEKAGRFSKLRYVLLTAVASLFVGYGIRGCGEETKPEEPTPIVKTVPKSDYENLHRELSAEVARLKSERKGLYTKEQADAAAQQRVSELEVLLKKNQTDPGATAELQTENKLLRKKSAQYQAAAEKQEKLLREYRTLINELLEWADVLKTQKRSLQGQVIELYQTHILNKLKQTESAYKNILENDSNNKSVQEDLRAVQRRISELETTLKQQTKQPTQQEKPKQSKQQTKQIQIDEKQLERQIQDLYSKIGNEIEFSYTFANINLNSGVSYERLGNLEQARLSYFGAQIYYLRILKLDKNHEAAKKGFAEAQKRSIGIKSDKYFNNKDYSYILAAFENAHLFGIISDEFGEEHIVEWLNLERDVYKDPHQCYESILSEYKDFLPAKIGLAVVQRRISELEAQIQKHQGGKK
jgi:myosin heavy subunit